MERGGRRRRQPFIFLLQPPNGSWWAMVWGIVESNFLDGNTSRANSDEQDLTTLRVGKRWNAKLYWANFWAFGRERIGQMSIRIRLPVKICKLSSLSPSLSIAVAGLCAGALSATTHQPTFRLRPHRQPQMVIWAMPRHHRPVVICSIGQIRWLGIDRFCCITKD